MATDFWWHGRTHWLAQMGEASWPTVHNSHGNLGPTSRSRCVQNDETERVWTSSIRAIPRSTRSSRHRGNPSILNLLQGALSILLLLVRPCTAAFVNFQNCLDQEILRSKEPVNLQFVPLYVWATFNSSDAVHGLNVTAYGNVTGIATQQTIPPSNDLSWGDPKNATGKIPDLAGPPGKQKYTTFTTAFNVLDYTPYNPAPVRFCNTSALTPCPLTPVFNKSITE